MNMKTEALLATARAYYERGPYIQYDECSMDRILRLTPRRRKMLPPEAATNQHTLFLDCSGFVPAVFYQTFGYLLPADLTWNIIDYVEPRVFYYELTHNETQEELDKLEAHVRNLLQPGDIITYDRPSGGGHTMLYIGDGQYTDCTPNGRPGSYDYIGRTNRFYPEGGIWIQDWDRLFVRDHEDKCKQRGLFVSDKRRFAISRPLDIVGAPTANAVARIGPARDLVCGVETSHPGGKHAAIGSEIEYRVFIKNVNNESKPVEVHFKCPEGAILANADRVHTVVDPGEEKWISFIVKLIEEKPICLDAPEVIVNTLRVFAPRVLCGRQLSDKDNEELVTHVCRMIENGTTALEAAAESYSYYNIFIENRERQYLYTHFFMHDSTKGEVLSRRPQCPEADFSVYSMFGGIGVITPEVGSVPYGLRVTYFNRLDLLPGDIILCSNDSFGNQTHSCFYTGSKLIGCFEYGEQCQAIENDELDRFLDSLPGRYCWILLRPCLMH